MASCSCVSTATEQCGHLPFPFPAAVEPIPIHMCVMCKSRSDASASPPASSASRRGRSDTLASASASATTSSTATTSTSASSSLAAARASLPDPPLLYSFQELAKATNNFLAKRASSSSSSYSYWRCSLRARDAALFQLRSRPGGPIDAPALAALGRYHHTSLARLLGACLAGPHVYLAYELPPGAATLSACLRNPRNPSFTALRTWVSRVQVAADVAQGLEYVHHHAGAVHGRVSSSTVLVSDPGLRARLTHFGASQLAASGEAEEESREADVHAFGVLLLELLSGKEAATYQYRVERGGSRSRREVVRVSVVETAAEAVGSGRVRSWVDGRLGDSFPVAAAERLLEVGLRCAAAEEEERPEMTWVAGKVSKVYVESRAWEQRLRPPAADDLSLSLAPR